VGVRTPEASLYDLLEVGVNATTEEITASYHRIASYLAPDSLATYSLMDEEELTTRRAQIDEAYRTLSDPSRRAAYDRARESGQYPQVLVPEEHSGATMSVGIVCRSDDEGVPGLDVDAIFRSGAGTAEPEPIPRRLVPQPLDDDEDDKEEEEKERPAPMPLERPPAHPLGSVRLQRPPALPPRPPSRPTYPGPRSGPATAAPGTAQRPGSLRRLGRAPSVSNGGTPGSVYPGNRRLHPSPSIEITPDTEFSGALLRRLRESCNATLDEVSDITKIRRLYLEAIEEHDFEALPAAVYVRGFVTEYARILGLDAAHVAKSYMAIYRRYRGEGS
jgi:hypothetical protein